MRNAEFGLIKKTELIGFLRNQQSALRIRIVPPSAIRTHHSNWPGVVVELLAFAVSPLALQPLAIPDAKSQDR